MVTTSANKEDLRRAVRFLYDLQQLRIETLLRGRDKDPGSDEPPTDLDPDAKKFQEATSKGMLTLEKSALREVDRIASKFPVYEWLNAQKGVGPTTIGFLLSEFDIHRGVRISNFWSFAGLGVVHADEDEESFCVVVSRVRDPKRWFSPDHGGMNDAIPFYRFDGPDARGRAEREASRLNSDAGGAFDVTVLPVARSPRPKKGEKLKFNRWLRSKCLFVLGGGLLKANNEKYRAMYDAYKHRKQTHLGPCVLCGGTGKAVRPKKGADGRVDPDAGKAAKCWNCVGYKPKDDDGKAVTPPGYPYTPDRAPWGRGDAHRHQAALRYMVKMFIADFWIEWRKAEGLPITQPYHEAIQGHVHGE